MFLFLLFSYGRIRAQNACMFAEHSSHKETMRAKYVDTRNVPIRSDQRRCWHQGRSYKVWPVEVPIFYHNKIYKIIVLTNQEIIPINYKKSDKPLTPLCNKNCAKKDFSENFLALLQYRKAVWGLLPTLHIICYLLLGSNARQCNIDKGVQKILGQFLLKPIKFTLLWTEKHKSIETHLSVLANSMFENRN